MRKEIGRVDIGFGWDSWDYTFAAQHCPMRQSLLALMFLPLIGWGQPTVVEDFDPDANQDGCITVADFGFLWCLYGTCGEDLEEYGLAPGCQPYAQPDSCYSAFDMIEALGRFQTCEEE